jgi:hypothetical protein
VIKEQEKKLKVSTRKKSKKAVLQTQHTEKPVDVDILEQVTTEPDLPDIHTDPVASIETVTTTPDGSPQQQASELLRKNSISPNKHPDVLKELTAFNILSQKVAAAPKKVKLDLLKNDQGHKKPRMASYLSKKLLMHRRAIFITRKQCFMKRIKSLRIQAAVLEFLKREENSTPLPGKRDQSVSGVQKYSLNDTIKNLHTSFLAENPDTPLSLSSFAKMRPNYMRPIQYADRRQCLCVRHRNGQLKMRAMRQTTSLSNFLNNNSDNQIEQIIHQLPTNSIRYQEWQREELIINGNIVKKLRLQQVEQKREDFAIKCKNEFIELRNHVRRVKIQYEELQQMKNNLTYGKYISCQLDYSENF